VIDDSVTFGEDKSKQKQKSRSGSTSKHKQQLIENRYFQDPYQKVSRVSPKDQYCHPEGKIGVQVPDNAVSSFEYSLGPKLQQNSQLLKSITNIHVILATCQLFSILINFPFSILDFNVSELNHVAEFSTLRFQSSA
jgi:hypothetical protein